MRSIVIAAAALAATLFASGAALAQEPPALAKAQGPAKEALKQLIAEASKEGQVSYIDTVIQPPTNDALTAAFRKYYGLPASFKVSYLTMAPAQIITRFEQEMRAGRTAVDVGSVGSPPWAFAKAKEGHFMQYDSPEYAAYTKAFELKLAKRGYFGFNGAYYFVPMWNSETLKFNGTSYKDIIAVTPAGRGSNGDASASDPVLMTYMGLRKVIDLSFFEDWAKLKPAFSYKSENTASRLVAGEDVMALYGMPTRAYQFNGKGAKLAFMRPQEGVVIIPQVTFIFAKAPHPAAAKLWFDFVHSDEGQKILADREVLMSGRSGFATPHPDYVPAIDQVKAIPLDYESISLDDMQKARAEWSGVFKKK